MLLPILADIRCQVGNSGVNNYARCDLTAEQKGTAADFQTFEEKDKISGLDRFLMDVLADHQFSNIKRIWGFLLIPIYHTPQKHTHTLTIRVT